MNDPKIIEWLNSHDSDDWRQKNISQLQLLHITVKEDYPHDSHTGDNIVLDMGVFW
jgi:hypothetical protein